MSLGRLIKKSLGEDFPVEDGDATRNNPLVITEKRDYVSVEYNIARYIFNILLPEREFEFEEQRLHSSDDRVIDELVFAEKPRGESEWTHTRRLFYDITIGFNAIGTKEE